MVLTSSEIGVLIDHYENLIAHINRRLDVIKDSKATVLLDPDIIKLQIDKLIDDRKVYENRLKMFKAAANF